MATRAAMTVGEVFIVFSVVLLLVGLLLPAIHLRTIDRHARSLCGNNLKQIATALIAYEQDSNGVPPACANARDAHEARLVTVRSFARLADAEDLRERVFHCQFDLRPGPNEPAMRARDPIAWGGSTAHHVSYAFDWSAPVDAGETRIVLADRSPRHGDDVMVIYGDTHVSHIRCRNVARAGGHHTEDADGQPVGGVPSRVESPPTAEDSIYDDLGDDGDALTPGKGSATRAWVK